MNTIRMALVTTLAASALALGACGDAVNDDVTGDDSEMTTPGDDSAMAPDDSMGTPPADNGNGNGDADDGDAGNGGNDGDNDSDRCGRGEVAQYVGEEATPDVRARITADVGHTRIRWVGPDTVVTMDFSPERLNVTLDANDIITGANCA